MSGLTDSQRARLKVWSETLTSERTREAYFRDVASFLDYCENERKTVVSQANAEHVATAVNKWSLSLKNAAPATINRKVSAVKTYLAYCGLREAANNAYRPQARNRRSTLLDPSEVDAILEHKRLMPRMRALVITLGYTPLGVDEMLELRVSDLEEGKLPGPYVDEVTEALKSLLGTYPGTVRKGDYLFQNYLGRKLSRQCVWKELQNAGLLFSPIRGLNAHQLRTSYVLRFLPHESNLEKLAAMCGLSVEVVNRIRATLREKGKEDAA